MIYRYVDRVNEKFKGGISVEKGVKSKHYIKKPIFTSKDSPLNLFKLLQLLTNEGINLVDAFELISESDNFNVDRKKSKEMLNELKNGVPFSESVANHYNVDSFIISFLKIGEDSGDISEILQNVSDYIEYEEDISTKIKKALYYPTFLLVMGLALLIFISKFVAPVFLDVLSDFGATLPFISNVAFGLSNILASYGIKIILIILAIYLSFKLLMIKKPIAEYNLRKFMYNKGLFKGLYRDKFQYLFFKKFSIIYKYQGNFEDTLKFIYNEETDIFIKKTIGDIIAQIRFGETIAEIPEFNMIFSPLSRSMLISLNREDVVSETTYKLMTFYEKSYKNRLDGILKLIGPIMISFIGILVAIIALGIMMPIFSMGYIE